MKPCPATGTRDRLRVAAYTIAAGHQAIGIMMAQQRCPATEAFALLSRASQNRNVKLHDLAVEIVAAVGA